MKSKLLVFLMTLFILTGCSAQLSKEKKIFTDKGITYSLQLPASWGKEKDYKEKYGQNAVFGAKDKKSNSLMFVSTTRKKTLNLKNFGAKTRKQLAETYRYKNVDDVYMKQFKLNNYQAFKYTAFTKFKDNEVWVHLYYIETKTGFVQLVYYSADDNNYKQRSKIIDQSARSLLEKAVEQNYQEEQKKEETTRQNDSVIVANKDYSFAIRGFRKIPGKNEATLLVIRYEITNLSTKKSSADDLKAAAEITQNGQKLSASILPENEKYSALGLLEKHQKDILDKDQSVETILVYQLNETKGEVLLTFTDKFPEQAPVILDLAKLRN